MAHTPIENLSFGGYKEWRFEDGQSHTRLMNPIGFFGVRETTHPSLRHPHAGTGCNKPVFCREGTLSVVRLTLHIVGGVGRWRRFDGGNEEEKVDVRMISNWGCCKLVEAGLAGGAVCWTRVQHAPYSVQNLRKKPTGKWTRSTRFSYVRKA